MRLKGQGLRDRLPWHHVPLGAKSHREAVGKLHPVADLAQSDSWKHPRDQQRADVMVLTNTKRLSVLLFLLLQS